MTDLDSKYLDLFKHIGAAASELGQSAYVVGGFVRDYYLGRLNEKKQPDIDIVTVGSGIALAEKVAVRLGVEKVNTFKRFGTAQFPIDDIDIEFVGARKESYSPDSRKPVVEDGTLEDDQLRRDFTINALSWSLDEDDFGVLNDPFGGIADLQQKIIRTPVSPETTFSDDPLRMLRAVRFANQLGFTIEPQTLAGIKAMNQRLEIVSKERIITEVNKMVECDVPSVGFGLMFNTGLLQVFFPEMVRLAGVDTIRGISHKDNFWHTLQVLDNVSEMSSDVWLRWSAVMHDIAKPATKAFDDNAGWTFHGHDAIGARWTKGIFRRLGLPLDERMKFVKKLVRLHLRPIALVSEEVTDSAIRRLMFDAGEDIDAIMMLCRADITSKNDRKVKRYLKNFDYVEKRIKEVEEKDRIRNWQPPVGGAEIMKALDLKPGPVVGKIKTAIEEAILNGDIPNEYQAAYDYMLYIKDDILNA